MRLLIRLAAAGYFCVSFYIFFLARRRPSPSLFKHLGQVNLMPIKNKLWYLKYHNHIPHEMAIRYFQDVIGNVFLFSPLPFFLLALTRFKSLAQVLLIAAGISFTVELSQFILSIGVADIDDIILNTSGAFLGYFPAKWLFRRFPQWTAGHQ